MAPPSPEHKHVLGETMHGLVVSVQRIETCLLGDMKEPGLVARFAAVEEELKDQREAKKERDRTMFTAVVGAVVTAVGAACAAGWAVVTGK